MGERMMKQWRKGIKIKLKKPVCRRHSKNSEKTKAPSLGHVTPKLSPPNNPTASAQANPGRKEVAGTPSQGHATPKPSSPHTPQLQPKRTPEGRKGLGACVAGAMRDSQV